MNLKVQCVHCATHTHTYTTHHTHGISPCLLILDVDLVACVCCKPPLLCPPPVSPPTITPWLDRWAKIVPFKYRRRRERRKRRQVGGGEGRQVPRDLKRCRGYVPAGRAGTVRARACRGRVAGCARDSPRPRACPLQRPGRGPLQSVAALDGVLLPVPLRPCTQTSSDSSR